VCVETKQRETSSSLHVREDGSFRIMIFTDLHFSCGHTCWIDHKTQTLVDGLLDLERPDLVVFNGDQIQSEGGMKKPQIFMDVFAPVQRRNISFAVIFGNHDSDGPNPVSREDMVRSVHKCKDSVTMSSKEFFQNDGNYIRTVQGKKSITKLVFLDTYRDSLKPSQVDWLKSRSEEDPTNANEVFATLVFMHIPPKEFVSNMCKQSRQCSGFYGEKSEYGPNKMQNGFYDVFTRMKGKVRGIVAGHDHKNDVCSLGQIKNGKEKVTEVLCYARSSGYGGYGGESLEKGARVLHFNENTNSIYSYVVNEMGERQQLLHFVEEEPVVFEVRT